MTSGKPTVLALMSGPKFDLPWEFGLRLEGLSRFSRGFLVTRSSKDESLRVADYIVSAIAFRPNSLVRAAWTRARYAIECVRIVRRARRGGHPVDVIITYDPLMTGLIGCVLAWFSGARLICELNGDYSNEAGFLHIRSPILRRLKMSFSIAVVRFVLRHATGIRVLFPDQLERIGAVPRAGQVVSQIPEFVNTDAFENLGEEPVVLLVGFPFFVKGVDVAIAAFKKISADFPDWRLVIMGHYPDRRQLAAAIGQCKAIEHHSPVLHRHIGEHIGRCGILIQPSRTEAMGRVLVEAMAAAKPRVASRVGGIPTVVADGVDGLLVDPEDIDGLAAALSRLMQSPELRHRLGSAGRSRASSEFSPDRYFSRVEHLVLQVLNGR